ncbi:MAG: 4-(cytidine 5'-diphospho)-2-C-methyl-D-erythritol kinase [Bacteroides sp.]|nr:4-(cytidine 5'-diphospho)-2-C-methyl-D-erythritol kinase [Bacteroides sp.]
MIVFPNAKINLGLHVTEKRPDGYHNLETLFYPVPVRDALEIIARPGQKSKCQLHIYGTEIAGPPEQNLVVKAYHILDQPFNLPPVEIHLYKHIPSGAGLGGGSSDASFMIRLLNTRFDLGLNDTDMERYASTLGADCAFFIRNSPALAKGIGNEFSPLSLSLKGYGICIIKPDIFVSTREAFALVRPHVLQQSLQQIISRPLEEWKHYLVNDFEESVFPQYPQIAAIKEFLYEQGAIYASMSGSGSSVFGIFSPQHPLPHFSEKGAFYYAGVLS